MINASKKFKEKLKTGGTVVNYADITLSDGTVLHLEPKDIMVGGCTIDDKTTDGKFGVGFVIGKTLSLRIANHDEHFSVYDFYGSIINLYVAMQLDNGTIEKIRKGVYYTTIPETPGDIIEISAADGMYRLDRDYVNSGTVYPATLQTIITEACLDCGIPIGFREFDNMSYVVQDKPEKATYRQVVSWACQIAGYNARIDNEGYMQLVWYNTAILDVKVYDGGDFLVYPHDKRIDGGDFFDYGAVKIIDGGFFADAHPEHIFRFKSLTVHTDDVVITGVQVVHEDIDVLFGETGYVIKVENNPFVAGKENQVADYLGKRMVGMYFRPFSGSVLGNPLYEPFDVCKVSDRKGNAYQSIINSVSYTVGSYTEIACQAEDPVRNGSSYYSEAAAAVVEARRSAEKQITEYDKAVQNMNQIAMNAMGFHTTYEDQPDGSRITYLHDKPTLGESKIIYKQTIDGFFVSQDGGKSYTAGFDSHGNVVVNILYAIGIVADWIRTGRLVVRDSKNAITLLADVDTGQVIINAESVSISGKTASTQEYADSQASSAAKAAVDRQTQADVFNKLTDNGAAKGLWIRKGQLYFSFSYAEGGTLVLGGLNNGNGIEVIKNALGVEIGRIDNSGVNFKHGTISFGNYFKVSVSGELYSYTPKFVGGMYLAERFSSSVDDAKYKIFASYSGDHMFLGDSSSGSSGYIWSTKLLPMGIDCFGDITATGAISCAGTKSRIMDTKNYSQRKLYCYEMPSPIFGDIGEAETDENGECYIYLDDVFSETVNSNIEYQVFLQKEGSGDIWISEKNSLYFVVKGTKNLKFSWEIKVKQKGNDCDRLEIYDGHSETEIDQEAVYMREIEILKNEREALYESA